MICTVCGKSIKYCGTDSPMLINKRWKQVIEFYNLVEYEKEAYKRMCKLHSSNPKFFNPENHTFICKKCIEKALGREIQQEDCNKSPFNEGLFD